MIKGIDKITCTNCGLCEDICTMDVFRKKRGKVYIAYPHDCCNCLQCMYICPVDAITVTTGVPKKYNINQEWSRIKEMIGTG